MNNDLMTILEVTDTHIKLIQGRDGVFSSGEVRVIDHRSDPAVALEVAGMMRGRDVNPEGFLVVVPRRFAVLKLIELPSQNDDELRGMVRLQLGNHIPYSREDVMFEFQVVEKNPGGYSKVLLAAVHKDVVERYLGYLQGVKISPQSVVMSSFGILAWWQKQPQSNAASTAMVINIDNAASEICFFSQRNLRFSRHIQLGSRDLQDEGITKFLEQVGLTVGTYKKEEMGPEVGQIFVLTSLFQGNDLRDRLKGFYSVPVEVLAPLSGREEPAFFRQDQSASPTVALGFLRGGRQLNFMPAKMQTQKRTQVLRMMMIRLAVLLVLAAALGLAAWQSGSYHDWVYLSGVERKAALMKSKVSQAEGRIRLHDLIRKDMQEQVIVADLITGLIQLVPTEVVLSTISLEPGGTLSIQGVVSENGSVNNFQRALSASPLFKNVTLDYATKRRRATGMYTEFRMVCKLAEKKEGTR